jgi:hypothetical protein
MYLNFMLMSYSMFKLCRFEMNEGNTCPANLQLGEHQPTACIKRLADP